MADDVNTITELQAELALVKSAINAMYTNGQKHSLNGSHSFEGVDFKTLTRRKAAIESQLIMLNGGNNYTLPDYSGDNSSVITANLS